MTSSPTTTAPTRDAGIGISSLPSVPQAGLRTEIIWDSTSGDYLMRLDGQDIGYASTYGDAAQTLDELIFAIRYAETPGTDCPSCGDLLTEDATHCAACREAEPWTP